MDTKERCWGCAHNENRQDGVSARADLIIINERGPSMKTSKQALECHIDTQRRPTEVHNKTTEVLDPDWSQGCGKTTNNQQQKANGR